MSATGQGVPILVQPGAGPALVVGGGPVAERKVRALRDGGIAVRVVAPDVSAELERLAEAGEVELVRRAFTADDVAGARLVVAATDDPQVNAAVAAAARAAGALVNVADDPAASDFVTPAVHRSGALVIAVNAGGVPAAAARVRDALAERFDARYAEAIGRLTTLRAGCLARGERGTWRRASATLLGPGFCAAVESGRLLEEVAAWR